MSSRANEVNCENLQAPPNQKSWLRQWLSCLSVRTQISKRLELSTPNYRPTVENYDVVCGVGMR